MSHSKVQHLYQMNVFLWRSVNHLWGSFSRFKYQHILQRGICHLGLRTAAISTFVNGKKITKNQLIKNHFCNFSINLKDTLNMAPVEGMRECFNFCKYTAEDIGNGTDQLMADLKIMYDSVGCVPLEKVTYATVVQVLAEIMTESGTRSSTLVFPQFVSIDKALRDASVAANKKLDEFEVQMSMRQDIFLRVLAFKENVGLNGLNKEQIKFVDKLIQRGKRNGLHLSDEIQTKLREIKMRISELEIQFTSNLNEENTKLYFSLEELAGMPDDFISELTKTEEGKYEVTLKYPHLFPVTKKCRISNTRRLMETANQSRCIAENTPIIEELIELRHKQAILLNYTDHATFMQEILMANNPKVVNEFLMSLREKLLPLWMKERDVLLQLKKEECEKYGYEYSGHLDIWDNRYYMNQVEEKMYAIDEEVLRQYFPLEKVISGIFKIYQTLLGLKFHLEEDADVWHEDVKLYRVNDAKSDALLGYFFIDLHPREAKYGHAAIIPLQSGCKLTNGMHQVPICAMVCNFTKPTKEKPALLEHSEVETFFHEFGHAMHDICSHVEFSYFHGTDVQRDFVEAPSQMLENWVWEKEALVLMSSHYKTGDVMPDELIDKLAKSRLANAGSLNLRQIVLSLFDQRIHTRASADTKSVYAETYLDVMDVSVIPNTNMAASFGHLVSCDANYYGYLWSEVFSADMYESCFKKEGILNPTMGMKYRTEVLQPGASIDAIEVLHNFLGREPSNEAFLKKKGLTV